MHGNLHVQHTGTHAASRGDTLKARTGQWRVLVAVGGRVNSRGGGRDVLIHQSWEVESALQGIEQVLARDLGVAVLQCG